MVTNSIVLTDFLSTHEHLLAPSEHVVADTVDKRKALIMQLDALANTLTELRRRCTEAAAKAEAAQVADAKAAEAVLTKLGGRVDQTWQTRPRARVTKTRIDAGPPLRMITESLGLSAIAVSSFDQVKQDGSLYWVESADHFAMRIAGQLFHGNIGTIYTDDRSPEKIKDCRFPTCGRSRCDYYHDPAKYADSRDRRNFIASSWLYTPPANRTRGRGRRFGSLANLDYDIAGVQDDEAGRLRDQCMHDLLCSLLLGAYRAK